MGSWSWGWWLGSHLIVVVFEQAHVRVLGIETLLEEGGTEFAVLSCVNDGGTDDGTLRVGAARMYEFRQPSSVREGMIELLMFSVEEIFTLDNIFPATRLYKHKAIVARFALSPVRPSRTACAIRGEHALEALYREAIPKSGTFF